jgi:D-alanine-D-alanine ligase-like ATP-grasp enzyme
MLGMSFGAVDFLVDTNYNIYFIEINSAPGFSELSKPIYVDAFQRLKQLSKKDLLKLVK